MEPAPPPHHERPLRASLSSNLTDGTERWDVVTIPHGQAQTHLAEGWEPIGGYYVPDSAIGGQHYIMLRRRRTEPYQIQEPT